MKRALDTEALRRSLAPGSEWARENGERVKQRREACKYTVRQLAQLVDVPAQTIYKIESGENTARDYLRLSIAHALLCEVDELFRLPTREQVHEYMDVAA